MFNDDCDCESKKSKKFHKKRNKEIDKYRKKYKKSLQFVKSLQTDDLRSFYFSLQDEINARTD